MFNSKFVVELLSRKRSVILLVILMAITAVRFYKIDGGLVLGEPDEFIHQGVADNFKQSQWPTYGGVPWLFQIPLYPVLGHWLSPIFPQRYVALRVVSVFSSLLLVLGTFLFFKAKISLRAGFFSAFFLSISPFSIYISRLALLDSTVVSFGILSIYAQDYALETKNKKWSLLAGLFLTISLMTKYTALIYLIGFFSVFLFFLVKDNWRLSLKDGLLRISINAFLPLLFVTFLVVPVLLILRSHDSYFFKLQTLTSLGFIRDFWKIKGGELGILYYLNLVPWWITWPILVFSIGGLVWSFHQVKKFPLFFLVFILTAVITLPFRPFYPRYFYPIAPFASIFAGLFLTLVTAKVSRFSGVSLFLLSVFLVLPTAKEAFYSTDHRLIEDTGSYIRTYRLVNPWIFSNYWPHYFGLSAGSSRATWLSDSVWDARSYVPDIKDSPLKILEREGGFVVLELNYSKSKMFIHPETRINAREIVTGKYELTKVIADSFPNFPHQKNGNNQTVIYFVPPSK